jgi:hypothetical protein
VILGRQQLIPSQGIGFGNIPVDFGQKPDADRASLGWGHSGDSTAPVSVCYTTAMPRKLRIAVSVFFGLLTVALCVLWVRSFSRYEQLGTQTARDGAAVPTVVESWRGQLWFVWPEHGVSATKWFYDSTPPEIYFHTTDLSEVWRPKDTFGFAMRYAPELPVGGGRLGVAVPHWFLVAVLIAIAAAPWVRWYKRFSLRTLLIATTLVAVLLGLAVWAGQ